LVDGPAETERGRRAPFGSPAPLASRGTPATNTGGGRGRPGSTRRTPRTGKSQPGPCCDAATKRWFPETLR